jgi:tetrahydromethanopterin:alpha-L-glutamate ligase
MRPSADIVRLERRAGPWIAILAEPRDSHAIWLRKAFDKRGANARIVQFQDFAFDTAAPLGIAGPWDLPQAVFVRTVPGGAFEAVTRRLGLLHAMRELGIPVWNDARAIERCVDKSMTSFLLARAGIPTPATWTVETEAEARAICAAELGKGPLVVKPLFGSQGRGLKLIVSIGDLPPIAELGGVYYLQRFAGNDMGGFHDYRVLVSGGRALAAMRRTGDGWITNVKRGGRPKAVEASVSFQRLALGAARAVGAGFCGVDIIVPRGGEPMVLEVNSMPAWSGLQKVTDFSLAEAVADDFLAARRTPALAV